MAVNSMTKAEYKSLIAHFLIDTSYDCVSVINTETKTIYIDSDRFHSEHNWSGITQDYQEAIDLMAGKFVAEEDKSAFLTKTALPYLSKSLEEKPDLVFTCAFEGETGKSMKYFHYTYLSKDRHLILSTIVDTTDLMNYDQTAECYNRRGFIQLATSVLNTSTEEEEFAILYLNIRGFKAVNELFGTDGGDQILRQVPELLAASFLQPKVMGRMGADHFVCLVEKKNLQLDKLNDLLNHTYTVRNGAVELCAVCGIYYIDKEEKSHNISHMCDRARLANEYVKDEYVTPYVIFDAYMGEDYILRRKTLHDLNNSIEKGEFQVFYQPVYDVKTRKIASAEALVRWKRSDGENITPAHFIPALEESGRISQLDLFVERQVVQFLESRKDQHKFIVPVSMNMSQMDFYDKEMMASVLLDISNTTLSTDYTRFEVTETAYSSVAANNRAAILALKDIGVKIYLDDFGSGYSSFSTIRDYNFDVLKLDMGFVQKIGMSTKAEKIVRSIIEMSHAMGTKVVAEGAETEAQVAFLEECNCDYIQGFYFSKPLPREEFEQLLNEQA